MAQPVEQPGTFVRTRFYFPEEATIFFSPQNRRGQISSVAHRTSDTNVQRTDFVRKAAKSKTSCTASRGVGRENVWNLTSTSSIRFHGMVLTHKGNFVFHAHISRRHFMLFPEHFRQAKEPQYEYVGFLEGVLFANNSSRATRRVTVKVLPDVPPWSRTQANRASEIRKLSPFSHSRWP
jgi:hypothetical protein